MLQTNPRLTTARPQMRWLKIGLPRAESEIFEIGAPECGFAMSSGVSLLNDDLARGQSWIARGPWRDLPTDEHFEISRTSQKICSRHLALIDLGPMILNNAHRDVIPRLAATAGRGDQELTDAMAALRTQILEALDSSGLPFRVDGPTNVVANRPGMLSTAYDYVNDRLIGLHIDNHQKLSLNRRDEAYVLLSMNIGWAPRYLHFVPRGVMSIASELGVSPSEALPVSALKDRLLQSASDLSVVRVEIQPGTAYLLNTQNVLHDGETPDGSHPDVTFMMMGALK